MTGSPDSRKYDLTLTCFGIISHYYLIEVHQIVVVCQDTYSKSIKES